MARLTQLMLIVLRSAPGVFGMPQTSTNKQVKNTDIIHKFVLTSTHVELRIRRSQWWQQICANPSNNVHVIVDFFGKLSQSLSMEYAFSTDHLWLKQVSADLATLEELDGEQELAEELAQPACQ